MAISHRLPVLDWLPRYRAEDLRADAAAGLTTAAMLVPQGMGYALLAGLPPIAGLYAATLPLVAYAIFGTSRPLAVGPVAIDSVLVALAVGAMAEAGSDAYLAHAITLAALVGTFQVAFGLLGLGFVANFLSRPVLSGFASAAALIIAFNQLGHVLALDLPRTHRIARIAAEVVRRFDAWHWPTLLVAAASLVLLAQVKRRAPAAPRALVAVVAMGVAVALLDLDAGGVAVVGEVPRGLPGFALPSFEPETVVRLLPSAVTIALIAFVEAISVGSHFARLGKYRIRPGMELVALGAANLASSVVGGYVVTGGFSRTAVNAQAGARTPMAGVVAGTCIALTLLVFTPLFRTVPNAVLAAIILGAVIGLFDVAEPRRLWRVKRTDFWLLACTFVGTLALGVQWGVLVGAGLSMLVFLGTLVRPHLAVLGQIPGTEAYLNVTRHPHAIRHPGVIVVRIDAQFFFGNVTFLRDTLAELEAAEETPLRSVVLDASGVNQLDSTAEAALWEIDADYAERGVQLLFAHVKGPVRDVMHRSGLLTKLNQEQRVFFRTHDAVQHALGQKPRAHRVAAPLDRRAPADRVATGPSPRATEQFPDAPPNAALVRGAWI